MVVYPAASFIQYFSGKHMVLMNKSTTTIDRKADIVIRESIDIAFENVMRILEN